MKNKKPLILFLAILIATSLACAIPAVPTLATASTPPALPQFVAPTPIPPTPTYAPLAPFNIGDSITITDGQGKYLWIEFLGNVSGYNHWNCISNAPEKETECKGSDLEVHQNFFYWGHEKVAFNGDGNSEVKLYGTWHLTTPADKPMLP